MTANAQYILDLPRSGYLGSLLLRISNSCAGAVHLTSELDRIVDFITKVEVIKNGSTIVKSLAGDAVQALAHFDQGVGVPDQWRTYSSNTQWAYFVINFGRYLFDKDYGLDLGAANRVELKITNTFTAATGWATSPAVDVIGKFYRGTDINPFRGYMRSEEWRSWTTVANKTEYFELPTDMRIRRILLQTISDRTNGIADCDPDDLMYTVKYGLKGHTMLVFNDSIHYLRFANWYDYGREVLTSGQAYKTADYGFPIGLARQFGWGDGAGSGDGDPASTIPTIEATDDDTITARSYEADHPINWISRGWGFHDMAVLRHDYSLDPTNWLDPEANKVVRLDITTRNSAGAADGTNKIILDRLVAG